MMASLEALFANGTIAIIAMIILVAECLLLLLFLRGRFPTSTLIWNTFSGMGLLASLYSALTDQDWKFTAAFLFLSLVAHLGDLVTRLSQGSKART